ncbi:uncharacterized protein [Nicotiana sylvestris]|uniref:uncharacterized protein n=1 Tax=Nicotiana sylvestris TaxID=4096 RepID=UPI00388C5D69
MEAVVSPQLQAVGEQPPVPVKNFQNDSTSYAAQLSQPKLAATSNLKNLKHIEVIHGVPTIQFSVEERMQFAKEHQIRTFPWSIGFKTNEETTKAVVWISLPNLPTELFAMKALLSIASAVGKPIAIDKATQTKSRPSTARVKVILDLMDKLPDKIKLQFLDKQTDKMVKIFQEFVYDNLPLYCNHCKHQGHDEKTCLTFE